MSRQEESILSGKEIDALNARGHFAYKNHGSIYMPKGLPDVGGCSDIGRGIFLETKVPGKRISGLSSEQFAMMRNIVKRCPTCICCVVTSVAEAIAAVEGEGLYPLVTGDCVYMVPLSDHAPDGIERIMAANQRHELRR